MSANNNFELLCPHCGKNVRCRLGKDNCHLSIEKSDGPKDGAKNNKRESISDLYKKEIKSAIEWLPEYNTRIEDIDKQHRHFMELVNEINYSVKSGTREPNFIRKILHELESYVNYHFSFEEEMFSQTSYPQASFHKQRHKAYADQIKEISLSYDSHIIDLNVVFGLMKGWFLEHIVVMDLGYVVHVKDLTSVNFKSKIG
ncbi:MAG: hemerythrin family protein [Oligoflexales bacterium]|nr:hemerythrin family protein [Oligoflexales bacterium]